MEFFNKKEDVIDLELTPVGEILLSQGEFKPAYYAFFDDEILYDGKYGGLGELQKEIKGRIKDTVRMKPQVVFRTVDKPAQVEKSGFMNLGLQPKVDIGVNPGGVGGATAGIKIISGKTTMSPPLEQQFLTGPRILEQDPVTKNFALPLPLGKSSYDSISIPSWDIKFLHGTMLGGVSLLTSSVRPFLKIPQIDAEIVYKSYETTTAIPDDALSEIGKNKPGKKYSEFQELHEDPVIVGEGETEDIYYDFDEDFIVLEVIEENTDYLKDNFDIEVFEIEEQTSAQNTEEKDILIP